MFKAVALTLLSASLLAGCGVSPTAPKAASMAARGAVQAKFSADDRRVQLRVPAQVLAYIDDYAAKLRAEHEQEMETDMYGRPMYPKYRVTLNMHGRKDFKVVATIDGFKTTLSENTYNAVRTQSGRDILVPFNAPVGPVTYYLEVYATIESTSTGKVVKKLPVHYISDMGRNYQGRLELERH
jgi:hypothetical protein